MAKQKGIKIVAQNKKAYHDYFVEETYECGLSLMGTEVKSMRQGRVNLKESFCIIRNGEIFAEGMHISVLPWFFPDLFHRVRKRYSLKKCETETKMQNSGSLSIICGS